MYQITPASMIAGRCIVVMVSRRARSPVAAWSTPWIAASVLAAAAFLQLRQHLVEREAAGLLPGRVLDIGLQMLTHNVLRRNEHESAFNSPLGVFSGLELGPLERIGAQVDQLR